MKYFMVLVLGCSMVGCANTFHLLNDAQKIPALHAKYSDVTGDEWRMYYEDMQLRLESWGFQFLPMAPTLYQSHYGASNAYEGWVMIHPEMSWNTKFTTLCHEAAHLMQPPGLGQRDKAAGEAFAEVVAQKVGKFYGANFSGAQYLAAYKDGFEAVREMKVDVELAVSILTGQGPRPIFTFTRPIVED